MTNVLFALLSFQVSRPGDLITDLAFVSDSELAEVASDLVSSVGDDTLSAISDVPSPQPAEVPSGDSSVQSPLFSHPLYQQLQTTLQSDLAAGTMPYHLMSTISVPTQPPAQMSVSLRSAMLQMQLDTKRADFPDQVAQIQGFYQKQATDLESERFAHLQSSAHIPYVATPINNYYDSRHHFLIDRLEQSVALLVPVPPVPAKQPMPVPAKPQPTKPKKVSTQQSCVKKPRSATFGAQAVRIMQKWYSSNEEHPYPSYETAEVMATAGGLTVEQVKKWFANKRKRLGNTKKHCDIAARRKTTRKLEPHVMASLARDAREAV